MNKPHKIAIVVDPVFGRKLCDLSKRLHVWICATSVNLEIAKEIQSNSQGKHSLESGVTTFNVTENELPEDMLINILDTVDLHHGESSHEPPWSVLEIYGQKLTPNLESKLARYGKGSCKETQDGFIFYRNIQ